MEFTVNLCAACFDHAESVGPDIPAGAEVLPFITGGTAFTIVPVQVWLFGYGFVHEPFYGKSECDGCRDAFEGDRWEFRVIIVDEGFQMSDVEADADTLASAGWGTDEDYGHYGGDEW